MKTKLEQALDCVINLYHQYAILNPVDDYLHPKEFEKLIKEQASHLVKNTSPNYLKEMFQKTDKDKNGYLTFDESLSVFMALLDEVHERSHDIGGEHKTPGHGHGGHCH